jgi:hypothetical protein
MTTGNSAVLRRLGRRTYGRRRGRTGDPPRTRRMYDTSAARFEAPRARRCVERWGFGWRTALGREVLRRRVGHGCWRPACARDVAVWARPAQNDFANDFFENENSNFLNKSALTVEHESCISNYPLSFSKRLYRVFPNRICKKQLPILNVSLFSWTVDAVFGTSFSSFST